MKRSLLVMMVLGCAHVLSAQTVPPRVRPPFRPAHTLSVTDIPVPILCTADGTVVLEALITEAGTTQEVAVRRDIACLSQVAVQAVKEWKFTPATFVGKAVASRIPVAVTFRWAEPYEMSDSPPVLKPQRDAEKQAEFQPAEVTHTTYPRQPYNVVAFGSVVLEVTLSATGQADEVKVLRDLPPLTAEAKAVVDAWQFMPATFNGNPVRSKIVLAFVFGPTVSDNP